MKHKYRGCIVAASIAICAIGAFDYCRMPPPGRITVDCSQSSPAIVEAIEAAQEKVRMAPRSAAAWGELGMLLRANDFDMDSLKAFEVAERLDPSDGRWPYLRGLTLVLIDANSGIAALRIAVAISPPERIEPALRLADVLLERGELDDASRVIEPIVVRSRNEPHAGWLQSRIAAERGDWETVLAITERLREQLGVRKRAAMLRAEALRKLGREGAEIEVRRAAELPEDEAISDPYVREVENMKISPDNDLRIASELLERGKADEAAAKVELATIRFPNVPSVRIFQGKLLIQTGRTKAAREVLAAFTREHPRSVDGWFHFGVAQFLEGDATAAGTAFEKVITLKPDHALGHFNLGHTKKSLGDRAGAIASFETTLRCRPDHEPSRQAILELKNAGN